MTQYHKRTLALLGETPEKKGTDSLEQWANEQSIVLPASFLEWAAHDTGELLEKYSNDDFWSFHSPGLVTMEDGRRGLQFHRENQGNFDKLVLLDGSDDPPVLFGWLGQEPWTPYSDRFSDAVFAQIFDWQYRLEFGDEPYEKEIVYSGDIQLTETECLVRLRELYEELVTTRLSIDSKAHIEYRFLKSECERIQATESEGRVFLCITGAADKVPALEAALLEEFSSSVESTPHNSSRGLARSLDSLITLDRLVQLKHMFVNKPGSEQMARLVECHQKTPFLERVKGVDFPRGEVEFTIGGPEWGVRLCLCPMRPYWWYLDRLEVC